MVNSEVICSVSWGQSMDQSVAVTIERHIVDLEERVHKQDTLVKQLLAAELDDVQATLTLRALQQTLLLSREHLRFALRDEMGEASACWADSRAVCS